MRIALVSSFAPSLTLFRGALIDALVARGHDVIGMGPEHAPDVATALRRRGASYARFPLARAGLDPREDLHTVRALHRFFTQSRPDVVLSYTHKPVVYASLAAHTARVPRVFSMITGLGSAFISTNLKAKLAGLAARPLMKAALDVNDGVVLFNRDIEESFFRWRILDARSPIHRIAGSGVDLAHYTPSVPRTEPLTFLLIARLLVDKGIREYVEAAREVKRAHPSVRFVLVGPYDPNPTALSRDEVEGWAKEGVVEFAGSTSDVRPFLREASVYVLPSYAEGIPRTVLEAMATGRPVITTDAPGCRDTVVEGESGFFVPIKDARAIARAMTRFVDDPALVVRMGRSARALAEERFDVHRINRELIEMMGV